MEPLFSVIIPTYNRANLLLRALESLVAQTFKCFEVIVCDDGSTDNTKEVIDLYKDKLNLTYLWEENWGGPARPRNNGIRIAMGDWVCYLDSDDSWMPEKLEMVNKYTADYDVIYHDVEVVNVKENYKQILKSRSLNSPVFDDLFVNINPIPNSSVCVRKTIFFQVDGQSEDLSIAGVDDYDLWLKLTKVTEKFIYVPVVLGEYNLEDYSISKNKFSMYLGILKVLNQYKEHPLYEKAIKKRRLQYFPYFAINNKKEAKKIFKLAFSFNFSFIAGCFLLLIPQRISKIAINFIFKYIFKKYNYITV